MATFPTLIETTQSLETDEILTRQGSIDYRMSRNTLQKGINSAENILRTVSPQNMNIEGSAGDPLPSVVPTDYAAGAEIWKGAYVRGVGLIGVTLDADGFINWTSPTDDTAYIEIQYTAGVGSDINEDDLFLSVEDSLGFQNYADDTDYLSLVTDGSDGVLCQVGYQANGFKKVCLANRKGKCADISNEESKIFVQRDQATSIAELQDRSPETGYSVYLSLGKRSGWFDWDSQDMATFVTANSNTYGWFVPKSGDDGTNGAWRRRLAGNQVWVEHGGSVGDNTTVNTDAWQDAVNIATLLGHKTIHAGAGTHVIGEIIPPSESFTLEGYGRPRNQDQDPICAVRAESAGISMFNFDSASLISNPTFKNIVMLGFDENDITTKCIDLDSTEGCYGFNPENVGFINCDFGWYMPSGFQCTPRHVHGWNCATAIGYGPFSVSNVYENPRVGKVPSGDAIVITGITNASPAVVTAVGHGLTDGRLVWIDAVAGMTEVNQKLFVVANATTDTFELKGIDSSAFGSYISGGEARRTACGYWLGGPNALVLGTDTAAEQSGVGSVMYIVGEADSLTLSGNFNTSHCHFDTCHFEGTQGAFVWVTNGSNSNYTDPHIITSTNPLPRAIYYEFINDISYIKSPQFTTKDSGSYTTNVEIAGRQKGAGKLDITPYSLSELPSVSSNLNLVGFVNYNVGFYGFSARMNSAQTIPIDAETKIIFGLELFDSDNFYNTTTGNITPITGFYEFGGGVYVGSVEDGESYQIRLKVDNVEVSRSTVTAAGTRGITIEMPDDIIQINGGEVVTVDFFHTSSTTVDISSGIQSKISMTRR